MARLNPMVKTVNYAFSDYQALLGIEGSGKHSIGYHGENLSIVVLSCNRAVLTIRLMESVQQCIPGFAGEFLVIDNGSQKEELDMLRTYLQKMPFHGEIVELASNYGVAGGRNRALAHITTEWFLSLDNDIYFTDNPLPFIKEAIEKMGCHFLNMPLLNETGDKIFALGGHLYLHEDADGLHVGGGSVYAQEYHPQNSVVPFSLSTFLFGGASVINKHTFEICGGYDEGMFIGFEDIDFSLRLFRKGYKVGNCGIACLVHDHKKPENNQDRDYEKERFSREILKKSADYFGQKNGMVVWNNFVDEWLAERHKALGLSEDVVAQIPEKSVASNVTAPCDAIDQRKPKIALVVDSPNWAFANIAKQLQKHLAAYYEFLIIPAVAMEQLTRIPLLVKDCDLVHFFWRMHINELYSENAQKYIESIGGNFAEFYWQYINTMNISTCVYDHLYLDGDNESVVKNIFAKISSYYVSSYKLADVYSPVERVGRAPSAILPDGVDTALFLPANLKRFQKKNLENRKIVVGWVGNSKWDWIDEDLKGLHSIIKPAIQELVSEGYPFSLCIADRNDKMVPQCKMPSYYEKIDVYICASQMEGTPNPVLEAMACGVPVISTDVGIVSNAFGSMQQQFILQDRSVAALKQALLNLYNDKSTFEKISKENLQSIKKWDWSVKAMAFKPYFDECLKK